MGRQIQLHLLGSDVDLLLDHIRQGCDLAVLLRDSEVDDLATVADPQSEHSTMTLWNRDLLPNLRRKTIRRNDGSPWHFIEDSLPTLDLWPCNLVAWNEHPGLLQGRIYTGLIADDVGLVRWYESIVRWIRRKFRKSPSWSGYVGPEAWEWFQQGGLLLPMFAPPVNPVWIAELEKQASQRGYSGRKIAGSTR